MSLAESTNSCLALSRFVSDARTGFASDLVRANPAGALAIIVIDEAT